MAGVEYDALLRRRRIWGVPPDVVEYLAADCQREQTELRARVKELEGRLTRANAERDDANQTVAGLQERVVRLEQENQEIANRPEMIREEALRFVVDAWTEAQTLRDQTKQESDEAEAKAREEIAAMWRNAMEEQQRHEAEMADERQRYAAEMASERQRYEAEISALRERRQKAIVELESFAASILRQATRGTATHPASTDVDDTAPVAMEPSTATSDETDDAPHTPPSVDEPPPNTNGGVAEDQLLGKALDDLEAILSMSRRSNGG